MNRVRYKIIFSGSGWKSRPYGGGHLVLSRDNETGLAISWRVCGWAETSGKSVDCDREVAGVRPGDRGGERGARGDTLQSGPAPDLSGDRLLLLLVGSRQIESRR